MVGRLQGLDGWGRGWLELGRREGNGNKNRERGAMEVEGGPGRDVMGHATAAVRLGGGFTRGLSMRRSRGQWRVER